MSVAGLALHPFTAPRDLPEALGLLAERAARNEKTVLLAGGTDWFVERHVAPPETEGTLPLVLDVSRLDGLRGISLDGDTLRRSAAAVTYLELRKDARVASRAPLLAAMARDVGALQIQARGTLAGNLASGSPAADGVCALAALDATLLLAERPRRAARPARGLLHRLPQERPRPRRADRGDRDRAPAAPAPPSRGGRSGRARRRPSRRSPSRPSPSSRTAAATRLGLGMASVAPTVAFLPATRALGLSRPLAEITAADLDARRPRRHRPDRRHPLDRRLPAPRRRRARHEVLRGALLSGSLREGAGLRSTLCAYAAASRGAGLRAPG